MGSLVGLAEVPEVDTDEAQANLQPRVKKSLKSRTTCHLRVFTELASSIPDMDLFTNPNFKW